VDAEVIERDRSEGDRRRTYLRLRPDVTAELAPAPRKGVHLAARVDRLVPILQPPRSSR
jgi:DNA-binding MarR family transcriptional regulator